MKDTEKDKGLKMIHKKKKSIRRKRRQYWRNCGTKKDMPHRTHIAQEQEKLLHYQQSLNVNGLNLPIKRKIFANWMSKRQDLTMCCLQNTQCRPKDRNRLKVKGWRNMFYASSN